MFAPGNSKVANPRYSALSGLLFQQLGMFDKALYLLQHLPIQWTVGLTCRKVCGCIKQLSAVVTQELCKGYTWVQAAHVSQLKA